MSPCNDVFMKGLVLLKHTTWLIAVSRHSRRRSLLCLASASGEFENPAWHGNGAPCVKSMCMHVHIRLHVEHICAK